MCLSHAAQLTKHFQTTTCFDRCLKKVKILSLENGNAVAELKIEQEHTNIMGGLHGGLSATLVDTISSRALYFDKSQNNAGSPSVTVDLHLTFCKGAKIGDEIVIKAKKVKAGKSIAFLEVLIQDKATGDVLVKGSHTKCYLNPKK